MNTIVSHKASQMIPNTHKQTRFTLGELTYKITKFCCPSCGKVVYLTSRDALIATIRSYQVNVTFQQPKNIQVSLNKVP
jgi:predicted RNA-binding Zn-ribbon protein involved in translation (DUF1610 family)